MKIIPLTQGKASIVDDGDFYYLSRLRWHARKAKNGNFYAARKITVKGKAKMIFMHRLITNVPDSLFVDHKNHCGLDNRRQNLRICTNQENSMNQRSRGGTSKYKGVSWNKALNKWRSQITVNGKIIHLGTFQSEIEAAKSYDLAAVKHFGKFCNPNFKSSLQMAINF